jgi:two-component system response regulator HydG
MQATDWSDAEALRAEGNPLSAPGRRPLAFDTAAMGFLRKHLVDNIGLTSARMALTRLGAEHGWLAAEKLREERHWDTGLELERASIRISALHGLCGVETPSRGTLSNGGAVIEASTESGQHLLHFGRSNTAVCWTLCGFIAGYISNASGKDVCVLEERCAGTGKGPCHLVARTRAEWGDERAQDLRFFEPIPIKHGLDASIPLAAISPKTPEHGVRIAPTEVDPDATATSTSMRTLLQLSRRVAKVDATVLITGESGAGKERIAKLVHEQSSRASGPFLAVNCGAISEALLESELFGHARGAFTGATHERCGLFETAGGGTLLLDEIGEVSPAMQVKLLRVLQEHEIRRVGESKNRKVDVRVLAATNRDLLQAVASGSFRKDLYYRLNVVELHVPALRERANDVLPLARELLASASLRMKRVLTGLSPGAVDRLRQYAWPGNVRELENAMERAAALSQGSRVELLDLPDEVRRPEPSPVGTAEEAKSLGQTEKDYILARLTANGGNRAQTASDLQIGSATLFRKLKSYRLPGAGKVPASRT